MKLVDFIKKVFKINHNVVKGEVNEIIHLNITEEDEEQAKHLATLVAAGLVACGIPCGIFSQKIMARVLAYALRDLKDGVEIHDKLIIGRVIKEINENKGK